MLPETSSDSSSGVLWWRECALVAAVFAICLAGGTLAGDGSLRDPSPAAYILAAASSLTVLARRRAPVAALIAATICGMLAPILGLLPTPLIIAPAVACAYSLALRLARRRTWVVTIPCSIFLVALAPVVENALPLSWEDVSRLSTVVAAPLVAALLGRAARQRHRYVRLIEERAQRAEEDREAESRRKVGEERLRIARELHDLVAHQITLANAQAAVAARLFETRPGESRDGIDDVVMTTRQALDELRAAVGFLREHDDSADSAQPAPGLSQLPALIESFARAGLDVAFEQDGTEISLAPGLDLTAYRVIQEALTNVTKHSSAAVARVRSGWTRSHLTITISDDGPASEPPAEHRPGYGVVGMRERVAAVGGELTIDRPPAGGFVVTARVPLPSTQPMTSPISRKATAAHDEQRP